MLSDTLYALRILAGYAGLIVYAWLIVQMVIATRRKQSIQSGHASLVLRLPILLLLTILFTTLGITLWQPLPCLLAESWQWLGLLLFMSSLILYLSGLLSLRKNFHVASGFGASLPEGHQLVTSGPYRYLRHPMYLAVMLCSLGGLLLFQTWSMLTFTILMLGLIRRAQVEDRLLQEIYGTAWQRYARTTPAWWPKLWRSKTQ